ncbi:MAG: phosphoribosylanthranilate isomerase [bacterium]|nr:phosphoribosylanthranilate isomerase [bacterium]
MCIKIKICGFTRPEDTLFACELGADILGFNFVPQSRRYTNPYAAREMISSLPPFVTTVGVFADEEAGVVNDLVDFLGLDAVQLHGRESAAYCRKIRTPVIRAVRVGEAADLEGLGNYEVAAFLLDAKVPGTLGGSGQTFPWELARDLCRTRKVFVAGGLSPANVAEAIKTLAPYGVDTASGVESGPGMKDPGLMGSFIRAARLAANYNGGACGDIPI